MGYEEIPPTLIESTLFYSHGGGLSVCLHQAQASSIHANGVTLFGVVFSFSFFRIEGSCMRFGNSRVQLWRQPIRISFGSKAAAPKIRWAQEMANYEDQLQASRKGGM